MIFFWEGVERKCTDEIACGRGILGRAVFIVTSVYKTLFLLHIAFSYVGEIEIRPFSPRTLLHEQIGQFHDPWLAWPHFARLFPERDDLLAALLALKRLGSLDALDKQIAKLVQVA